jgi:hypothetical protein
VGVPQTAGSASSAVLIVSKSRFKTASQRINEAG